MSEESGMGERRAYRLTGRVQGVGFRWWTRKTAAGMDVRGTVRNAADGSVEIEVEAEPEVLDAFERKLEDGPGAASVDALERREPAGERLPDGFEIIR